METLSKESLSLLESLIQTGSSSFGDGIAERITDYLEQNLEQNVSLDMLAQSMNYSAAYLSRLIKKNTGQSFSELLLDLRLKKIPWSFYGLRICGSMILLPKQATTM